MRRLPRLWIASDHDLRRAALALGDAPLVALDVETTLRDHRLCLAQIADRAAVYLIDALAVRDLGPLRTILGDPGRTVVIHNAAFERRVLGAHDIAIPTVFDTLTWSRRLRKGADGGHSLGVVCARELGFWLDKSCQASDWKRRPLSAAQLDYAALDAEVLLPLYDRFAPQASLFDAR